MTSSEARLCRQRGVAASGLVCNKQRSPGRFSDGNWVWTHLADVGGAKQRGGLRLVRRPGHRDGCHGAVLCALVPQVLDDLEEWNSDGFRQLRAFGARSVVERRCVSMYVHWEMLHSNSGATPADDAHQERCDTSIRRQSAARQPVQLLL